jgi:hypothetical protein
MNMTDLTRPLKTCAASPWLTAVLVWLLGAEARALFVAKGHELKAARELSHARTHTHAAQG